MVFDNQVIHVQVEVSEASTAGCGTHGWGKWTCCFKLFSVPIDLTTQVGSLFGVIADQLFFFQLYSLNSGVCFAVFGDEELLLTFSRFDLQA